MSVFGKFVCTGYTSDVSQTVFALLGVRCDILSLQNIDELNANNKTRGTAYQVRVFGFCVIHIVSSPCKLKMFQALLHFILLFFIDSIAEPISVEHNQLWSY